MFCSFPGFCSILGNDCSVVFGSIPCLLLLVPIGWLSHSVVPDDISIMFGLCPFSRSNANSGFLAVSFFFFCFRTGSSPSLVQVDSDSMARLFLVFLNLSFWLELVHAMSLFENVFTVFDFSGKMDTVCAVSFTTLPVFLANVDSSFEPFDLSLTRLVESASSWKSDCWKSSFGSLSEISMFFPTKFDFTVFGSFPICFSKRDRTSFFLLTLSAHRISDKTDLSLVNIFCFFVRSLSLIVLINRSILPFPL